MKKLLLLTIILAFIACNEEEKITYVILNGSIENNEAENAMIRGNGFEKKIPISETGTFSDTLSISKDGYYQFFVGRERTGIYLEQGTTLSAFVNAKEFDETIKYEGELASENNYLAAKYLNNETSIDYPELFANDESTFVSELKNYNSQLEGLLAENKIVNETFNSLEKQELKYELASLLENFQEYHQYFTKTPDFKASENLYKELKDITYNDTIAFRNSNGYQDLVGTHFSRLVNDALLENDSLSKTLTYLNVVNKNLPNGYAKNSLLTQFLKYGLAPDKHLEEAFSIYKSTSPNQEDLEGITEQYTILQKLTPGKASPTFDYENHKGGKTSLNDLAGKYVYVDVWATWCGPCIREIPSLKEVEADYHGKNIEFVSLSIDAAKDHGKWKSMVTTKELGGIQLMADKDWKSSFPVEYNILGIPRFILIDPEGNIVSADAPRPSDPKLRDLLNDLI
ncbi:MAG: thiol-disulfide isomerase/thioredoxin [Flavobacteriaceae bacterium]|jgi:thiol-disulfide isomerase/thioredoxin|uniref:TlpA family protein disulfide reductase n=1 Tax=Candidatus Marifrigoribacter sp. Uisw_064 TaxID=3230970 RepID=UPI003ADEE2CD